MFDRLAKKLIGVVAVGLLAASAWAQTPAPAAGAAPKAPAAKDQGEYDLAQAAQKETDPVKKMDLLNQWEQKYADSDFKSNREVMMAQTEAAIALKALQPGASAADMEVSQKAAQNLADNLDKYLAPANKPAAVTDAQWAEAKSQVGLQAHTVLASIAMSKKTPEADAASEAEFKKILDMAPNAAATSYQLGTLILRERKVGRYPEALYYIARAIDDTGPQALAPAGKKAAEDYLKKAYTGYHGSTDGLDDLLKAATASPNPPAGFTIQSVTDIEKAKEGDEAKFNEEHPDIALWRTIKTALTAEGGDAYFGQVKGSEVPPQSADAKFKMFPAKVISQPSPKELLVNVDNVAGDATLQFETPLKGAIEPGLAIKFKGVVDAFVKDPYMVTFTGLGKEDVEGIPAAAFAGAPAARPRRAAPKKK